ncbi:hypothetical protein CANARDRAFT_28219 [[Candida] arabinofermentans NRRL YB-2248]|uniref:Uncharacterized protein n=1 Tax=[Candida] arabinofermentans NRRL YB-2248 TaxID=983967 RepID=A0A1E4T0Z3_9ASCO|nr:hypothetical protein CANARDRAFT_28219 [[Candida] arabinofermentans NRRL YB-2248]
MYGSSPENCNADNIYMFLKKTQEESEKVKSIDTYKKIRNSLTYLHQIVHGQKPYDGNISAFMEIVGSDYNKYRQETLYLSQATSTHENTLDCGSILGSQIVFYC